MIQVVVKETVKTKKVTKVLLMTLMACSEATLAYSQGVPAKDTLMYGGVAYENNAPSPSGRTIEVTVLRSNGAVACMGSAATAAGGRFSVPLPNSCVAAIETDNGVSVELRLIGTRLGVASVSAAPYAIESENAQHAVNATNAAPGGALEQRLISIEAPRVVLRCRLNVDQGLPVNGTSYRVAFDACPVDTTLLNPPTGSAFVFTAPGDGIFRVHAYAEAIASSFVGGGSETVRLR